MSEQSVSKTVSSPKKRSTRKAAIPIVDPDVQTSEEVHTQKKSGKKKGKSKATEVANEQNSEEFHKEKKTENKRGKTKATEEGIVQEDPKWKNRVVEHDNCEPPEMLSIHLRTTPRNFSRVTVALSTAQKEAVRSYGFGSLIDFQIYDLPTRLVHYLVENYNPEKNVINLMKGEIEVNPQSVEHVFGIPSGGTSFTTLRSCSEYVDFSKEWKKQFPEPKKKGSMQIISANMIADKILESTEVNEFFKMNFLMLFLTSVIHCENGGRVDDYILQRVGNDTDLTSLNWGEKVVSYLKNSKKSWKPKNYTSYYCGPATFLLLLYLDCTKFNCMLLPRERPVFKNWSSNLKSREALEYESGRFGFMEIRGPMTDETLAIEDYETAQKQLLEVCKIKRMLFKFLVAEAGKDPKNQKYQFFHSKLSEVFKMEESFYAGEAHVFDNVLEQDNVVNEEGNNAIAGEINSDGVGLVEKCSNAEANVSSGPSSADKHTDVDLPVVVEKETNEVVEKETNEAETNEVVEKEKESTQHCLEKTVTDNVSTVPLIEQNIEAGEKENIVASAKVIDEVSMKQKNDPAKQCEESVIKFSSHKKNIHRFNKSFDHELVNKDVDGEEEPKKRRGCPCKAVPEAEQDQSSEEVPLAQFMKNVQKKGRGRPPKNVPVQDDIKTSVVENVEAIKNTDSKSGTENFVRKKSDRIIKIKLGKKVVPKDGKGLEKQNAVDLQ